MHKEGGPHRVWTSSDGASACGAASGGESSIGSEVNGVKARHEDVRFHRYWESSATSDDQTKLSTPGRKESDCNECNESDNKAPPSDDEETGDAAEDSAKDEDPYSLHDAGECKPCLWVNNKRGCLNGDHCKFCHLDHQSASFKRHRPRKAKRNQCKRVLAVIEGMYPNKPDMVPEVVQQLSTDGYLHRLMMRRRAQKEKTGQDEDVEEGQDENDTSRQVDVARESGQEAKQSSVAAKLSKIGVSSSAGLPPKRKHRLGALELKLQSYVQSKGDECSVDTGGLPSSDGKASGKGTY